MVMLMDVTADQTMSSSPGLTSDTTGASQSSPSPFPNRSSSVECDEHEDEHSKCSSSGQTIVAPTTTTTTTTTMRQQEHRQQQHRDQQMVLSADSSFEEDDKRLAMHVDEDEGSNPAAMRANLRLEQAELEARLAQAKTTRFGASGTAPESSLVAQMRDIVEGGRSRDSNPTGANNTSLGEASGNNVTQSEVVAHSKTIAGQPQKSSSDSLNNQNENGGNSRASTESVCQKRLRHARGAHCSRHQHHGHHHHHHHHHRHRHRPSVGGGSIQGHDVAKAGLDGPGADPGIINSSSGLVDPVVAQPRPAHHSHSHGHHSHHSHHHHHHRHRRHAAPHNHHHHHHHHQEHKRGAPGANKRPSLAVIDPSGGVQLEDCGSGGAKIDSNDSSMTSVSSVAAGGATQQADKQLRDKPNKIPNQSKSSGESPPSDGAAPLSEHHMHADGGSPGGRHGRHHCHHHHHDHAHHHHCGHHRTGGHSHDGHSKRQLANETETGKSLGLEDMQSQEAEEEPNVRRRPLQDLASGANISASGGNIAYEDDAGRAARHHHHHHHHHPHQHFHHRHHHCAHRQPGGRGGEAPEAAQSTSAVNLDDVASAAAQQTTAANGAKPPVGYGHHHHHHCASRHHRHHHHHHHHQGSSNNSNNIHAHHHHCKQQRGQADRKKSISQTNVEENSSHHDDSTRTLDKSGELRRDSSMQPETVNASMAQQTSMAPSDQHANVAGSQGETFGSDEVVKMETSPAPPSPQLDDEGRRPSCAASQQASNQATPPVQTDLGGASVATAKQQVSALQSASISEAGKGDQPESSNAQFAANRENLQKSAAGADEATAQQNKLTRQTSSQSSRRSEKAEGSARGGDFASRKQSDRLRECAERALQPVAINQAGGAPARQMVEASSPADRRCKLCWCCCCPCSALSARNGPTRAIEKPKASQSGPPSPPAGNNYPSVPNVPLDEIRSWGESFDKLMKCSDGRKIFQDFLRCEYSEENILFWSACEELKQEKDSKSVAAKARDIYEDYISILSSKEVSLDSRVRDIINNNIKKPTSNIFDEAQLQIYTLMHRDSYPRFINSLMYKKLAQIPLSNSRKSSS